ncbi:hypothetical protein IFM89_019379 [Coptis chinensis]|uniref:Transposase n=1 Tax=Coptis chinensis TaxID=261450 RepID=A0A835IB54_9MAGN|nr:hypothetical protein IFM89_019379 [Coptis chinensis]
MAMRMDSWELDESKKETTLGRIASDEFRNKKTKWKKNFYSLFTHMREVISERNKRNRSKQIAKHTSGRKGFPEMRAQIASYARGAIGCEVMGRGVTPTSYFGSQASSHGTTSDRVAELENEMAEMRRVAQEKEEERQRLETPVEPMLESSARC